MMKRFFGAALAATVIALPAMAEYPDKDIKLIVPYGAGGGTDTAARLVQPYMEKILGSNLIITNMPGAGGTIGATNVARSKADGYTLAFLPVGTAAYQPNLRKVAYSNNSFAPICMTIEEPVVVSVAPDSPIDSLKALMAEAKKKTLMAGNGGPGTVPHIGAVLMEQGYGLKFKHVPLENSAKTSRGVLGGQVDWAADMIGMHMKFGLKPLAVMAEKRAEKISDVPTIDEVGGPPLRLSIWFGLFAPASTPQAIVDKLSASCAEATGLNAYGESVKKANLTPQFRDSAAFSAFYNQEYKRFADLFKEIGLKKK